ncbi:MAG: hypothetical protein ACOCZ7_04975, partial [Armatimonadota bacterium]
SLAWPLTGLLAANLLALALLPHPGTRGAMGPRYLLWSLPVLVLFVLPLWRRLPRYLQWALFAISFAPSYLAAMLTSHTEHAWSFWQIGEFGLTNYTLSRMQEAGLIGTPILSTAIVLIFWMVISFVFLRPGARGGLCGAEINFEQPRGGTSQESA